MGFAAGSTIAYRDVLHGAVWSELPVTVVSDDGPGPGSVLAMEVRPGAPLTFPPHPFGVHPWAGRDAWGVTTVLMLHREGDAYSVWKFFEGDDFSHWYVNFEVPTVRSPDGIEVNDLQLDLVVQPDGVRTWKDVDHLHPSLAAGRIGLDELRLALGAATEVTALLDRDERWWAPWDDWEPGGRPS